MAMEPGGRADKLGNEYERLWVVYQLLRVLRSDVLALTWEPAGVEGDGIDVSVELIDGSHSRQSCKRENAGHGKWTLSHLNGRGVLAAAKTHLAASPTHRFVFISRDVCPDLRDLAERARRYDGKAETYYGDLPEGLRRSFHQLGKHWGMNAPSSPQDRSTIFVLLLVCEAEAYPLALLSDHVRTLAESIVEGDADITRTILADFAVQRLGNRIERAQLTRLLESKNLTIRAFTDPRSVDASIRTLQSTFIDSIEPYLIGKVLIHRSEAERLIDAVTSEEADSDRLVIVHGRAGIGKSGAFIALLHALRERDITCLPIRLDRNVPLGSADRFGREVCGLPSSPVRALEVIAGSRRAVLVLDQLDALRWTAAHTDQAMEIVTQMVREALNPLCRAKITVVLVCRTFDLEDDPRIAHLKSIAKSTAIEIGPLTPEAARDIVNAGGQDTWSAMTTSQQRLLQEPQALYLWTRLKNVSGGETTFRTQADLMRAFWSAFFHDRRPQNVESEELRQVLDSLVEHMNRGGKLTAPLSLIHLSKGHVVASLVSAGVIRVDDRKQCIFTHQSYLDFLVADDLNRRLLDGQVKLADWLRASDQSLFRRDQLRLVLALQRDDDPDSYVRTVEGVLRDDNIRFHLKHLALRLLSQADPPIPAEVDLIVRFLGEEAWRDHLVAQVLWNKPEWFAALHAVGQWARWLASGDESLENMALRNAGFMSQHFGDSAVALLKPYVSENDPWPKRIAAALTWGDMDTETCSVFALRMTLLRRGQNAIGQVWWEQLAKKQPRRCIRLFSMRLGILIRSGRLLRAGKNDECSLPWIESNERGEAKSMREAAARCPHLVWRKIEGFCATLTKLRLWASRNHKWMDFRSPTGKWASQAKDDIRTCEEVLVAAGRAIARRQPQAFKDLVTTVESAGRTQCVERSLLRSMGGLPSAEADYAVKWLIAHDRRFRIGESLGNSTREEPARRLIERFAPHCSDIVADELERVVFGYVEPDLKRLRMFDHERVKQGLLYPSYHGRAQYILASAIPVSRLSPSNRDQLGVWQRKFGSPPTGDQFRSTGGCVGSTIPRDRVHCITDQHWLKIASTDWSARHRRHKVMGPDQLGEASHEHFASDIGGMARRQPPRFATLTLRLPSDAPADYLRQVLRGFELTDPPEILTKAREQNKDKPPRAELLDRELASWRAATREEIEAIFEKVGYPDDPEMAKTICSLIAKRGDILWSDRTLDLISRLAIDHPDPAAEQFHTQGAAGKGSGESIPDIANSGLNCVRGEAALAIREIILGSRESHERFSHAIDAFVADSNIAVRAVAISICGPLLNVDRDLAVQRLLKFCNTPDDRIFLSHYLDDVLRYVLWSHPEQVLPIVQRMSSSRFEQVAKRGAAWVTAAWLYRRWCAQEIVRCTSGSQPHRRGVAETAAQLTWGPDTAKRRVELLPALFDDDDNEVRQHAGRVFWRSELWQDERVIGLALRFIASRAFAEDPTPVIQGLESITGPLARCATVIYAIAEKFAGTLATSARDLQRGAAADVPHLFKLLLRLYQQAQDSSQNDVQAACLDRWDALLRAGVGSYRDTEVILDSVDR